MRWSDAFIPTLREDPADAEAASHRLLVRGGFIRQLMAGSYSLLPLGLRVATKIERVIREEMDRIGGQEFLLPVVHPGEVWKKTGRWDNVEGILVKFRDRRETDLVLAMTHEEVFTLLATELKSYRDLPQLWYHLQTKFRDEPRPKGGLLRVREFVMKDSYSFDLDPAGLDKQFQKHVEAYPAIFRRLGLDTIPVLASSGVMGGTESVEFMVATDAGEDLIAACPNGDYAANLEKATSWIDPIQDAPWEGDPEPFHTPGIRTIAALAEAHDFADPQHQIKTMAFIISGRLTLVLLRGDHDLMEQKLMDGLGTEDVRPASAEEIRAAMGAGPGSLGAVGVDDLPIVADPALRGRSDMVTGANVDDVHLRGVDLDRDIRVGQWLDVRKVKPGDGCPLCGHPLEVTKAIEVGHIFKLGTDYSEALDAHVLDVEGNKRILHMGSYGIGVGRNMAAIVEVHHDESGIAWPVTVAPYEVVVTLVGSDPETRMAGEQLYEQLRGMGIETILDDRDERPGVKFADADLIGIPYRLTLGSKGLAAGTVEVMRRSDRDRRDLAGSEVVGAVTEAIRAARG